MVPSRPEVAQSDAVSPLNHAEGVYRGVLRGDLGGMSDPEEDDGH